MISMLAAMAKKRIVVPALDEYTKVLLHFDGANNGTTFVDESGKVWTAAGNAKLLTDQKAFGTASGYFDGTGDYISTPDSDDFDFGANDWTIEWRMRADTYGRNNAICGQYQNSNNWWGIYTIANWLYVYMKTGAGVQYDYSVFLASFFSDVSAWKYVAVTRQGTAIKLFLNGVLTSFHTVGTAISNKTLPNLSGPLNIGFEGSYNFYFKGYLDEFRLSKGIARYTANFTPPTEPFAG